MLLHSLKPGEVISNQKLMEIFKCACEGGIRYSSKTNTLVLVNNNVKNIYPNRWDKNCFLFAGKEEKAQQGFTRANKRLNQFLTENKDVFLFEVNEAGKYEYKGRVKLCREPYMQTMQAKGKPEAKVWIFPLEILGQ